MYDEQEIRSSVAVAESSIAELESKPTSRLLWPGWILKRGIRQVLGFLLGPQLRFDRAVKDALEAADRSLAAQASDHADQLRRVEGLEAASRNLAEQASQHASQHADQLRRIEALESAAEQIWKLRKL